MIRAVDVAVRAKEVARASVAAAVMVVVVVVTDAGAGVVTTVEHMRTMSTSLIPTETSRQKNGTDSVQHQKVGFDNYNHN